MAYTLVPRNKKLRIPDFHNTNEGSWMSPDWLPNTSLWSFLLREVGIDAALHVDRYGNRFDLNDGCYVSKADALEAADIAEAYLRKRPSLKSNRVYIERFIYFARNSSGFWIQ